MVNHLKDRQEYEDHYDQHTVEIARWYEEQAAKREDQDGNKIPERVNNMVTRFLLYHYTGERWKNRDETINKWMEDDRSSDKVYENTAIPDNVCCFMCDVAMEFLHKSLNHDFEKKGKSMEFFFSCEDCEVGLKIKEGKRERIIPWMCPNCKRRMKQEKKRAGEKLWWKDSCDFCDYEKSGEMDLSIKQEEEPKPKPTKEEVKRFREDRLRFCLTDKEGHSYLEGLRNMKELGELMDRMKAKDDERKERLKKEPKGFALMEGSYSCIMCKRNTSPFKTWYDKYGIKCMTCQYLLERKKVPLKYFKDTNSWYSGYDLQSKYGIHHQTMRKLVREGKLKVHILEDEEGRPHEYLFPKKENAEFLKSKLKNG